MEGRSVLRPRQGRSASPARTGSRRTSRTTTSSTARRRRRRRSPASAASTRKTSRCKKAWARSSTARRSISARPTARSSSRASCCSKRCDRVANGEPPRGVEPETYRARARVRPRDRARPQLARGVRRRTVREVVNGTRRAALRLSLACWDYDRTRALMDGRVVPDGIDLVYQPLEVEETFFRQARHREFDVAEMSLSSYCVSKSKGDPFVAIPVFPSRMFRHANIWVHERSGIREPADLRGKRFALPRVPAHRERVDPRHPRRRVRRRARERHVRDGRRRTAGPHRKAGARPSARDPRRTDRSRRRRSPRCSRAGEIDAFHGPRTPSTANAPGVRRLFPDYVAAEKAYYAKTGDLSDHARRRDPARRVRARPLDRDGALQSVRRGAAVRVRRLPRRPRRSSRCCRGRRARSGDDARADGRRVVAVRRRPRTRRVLETFTRYHHRQGSRPGSSPCAELFAPETLRSVQALDRRGAFDLACGSGRRRRRRRAHRA